MYKFVLKKIFQKISNNFCIGRPQSQFLVETAEPTISNEEPVSETEFDALPEPEDTNSMMEEEQLVMTEDITVDIEPAKVYAQEPHT